MQMKTAQLQHCCMKEAFKSLKDSCPNTVHKQMDVRSMNTC